MCGLLFFTALPFIAASMITFAIVVPLDRFATQSNQRSSKKATTLPADDKDGPGRDAEVDGYGALLPYRTEQSEKRHHRAAVEQKQWLQGRALKLRSPLVSMSSCARSALYSSRSRSDLSISLVMCCAPPFHRVMQAIQADRIITQQSKVKIFVGRLLYSEILRAIPRLSACPRCGHSFDTL